jgi:lipopolysaccharide/colanic/teichoic acid biosynthesis glycosyltransferase
MNKNHVDNEFVGVLDRGVGRVAVLEAPAAHRAALPLPSHHHCVAAISRMGEVGVPLLRDLAERALALAALVVTLPAAIAVAVAIRLDSGGPALFRQWRVGRGGRLFRFTKFRTYHADARERWPELYTYEYTPEEVERLCFKVAGDPRATRVGRWLRQSTLDELPNFSHVVMGDMSLVGPRPEIPEMLPYYRPEELAKFTVKPGVTGISQISGRGLLSFRETARLDLGYVRNRSLWGDIRIALTTVGKVIFRTGAF